MKRCPTCDKTFEDSMRFCQSDGTPLVEDAPIDPYKTMVAKPEDIAAAIPSSFKEPEKPVEPEHEEVLEIPKDDDPRKTMIASKEEISEILSEEPGMEIPAVNEPATPVPTPPPFIAPPVQETPKPPVESKPVVPAEPPTPKTPTPPPSPFDSDPVSPDFSKTSPPIPSPFGEPKPPQFIAPSPASKPLEPAAPIAEAPTGSANPFDMPSASAQINSSPAEWQPPAAPEANWQAEGLGKDTPFQPPSVKGPSSMLAIISIVLGLLGLLSVLPMFLILFCGIVPFALGIAALVTGFMGRSRAKAKPQEYSGSGLAMGGIILGILSILAPIVITILIIVLYGALLAMPQF
jgi:hypothetical protein